MNTITTEEAVRLISQSGGRAFAATFTKRTDGSLRTMRCRLGVHKPPFPAHSHGHPTQEPSPHVAIRICVPRCASSFAARGSPNNCYCT